MRVVYELGAYFWMQAKRYDCDCDWYVSLSHLLNCGGEWIWCLYLIQTTTIGGIDKCAGCVCVCAKNISNDGGGSDGGNIILGSSQNCGNECDSAWLMCHPYLGKCRLCFSPLVSSFSFFGLFVYSITKLAEKSDEKRIRNPQQNAHK